MEDAGFLGELGGVPMVVSGEHGGLGLGIHAEDEGLGNFISGNSGKQNEEENDERKGIQYLFTHFKE